MSFEVNLQEHLTERACDHAERIYGVYENHEMTICRHDENFRACPGHCAGSLRDLLEAVLRKLAQAAAAANPTGCSLLQYPFVTK